MAEIGIFSEPPFRGNYDEQGPYIGGDMRFGENQLAELKSGILGSSYRWPMGRIPTEIDSSFSKPLKSGSVKSMKGF